MQLSQNGLNGLDLLARPKRPVRWMQNWSKHMFCLWGVWHITWFSNFHSHFPGSKTEHNATSFGELQGRNPRFTAAGTTLSLLPILLFVFSSFHNAIKLGLLEISNLNQSNNDFDLKIKYYSSQIRYLRVLGNNSESLFSISVFYLYHFHLIVNVDWLETERNLFI